MKKLLLLFTIVSICLFSLTSCSFGMGRYKDDPIALAKKLDAENKYLVRIITNEDEFYIHCIGIDVDEEDFICIVEVLHEGLYVGRFYYCGSKGTADDIVESATESDDYRFEIIERNENLVYVGFKEVYDAVK